MSRNKQFKAYEPKKCWVGEQQKLIFDSREEAEAAALVAAYDHKIVVPKVYKCEFGEHWHLSSGD